MDNWIIRQEIDLAKDTPRMLAYPRGLMVEGDKGGHTWQVQVRREGKVVSLSGMTVTGYFVNQNGETILVSGAGSAAGLAQVTLNTACYAVPGRLKGIVRASSSSQTITLGALYFDILEGASDVYIDPDDIIPSLEDLIAMLGEMEQAANAAQAATASANTAAGSANAAATSATNAATSANTAATNANTARTNANNAATAANTARDAANTAATGANAARDTANTAAGAATLAASNANTARDAANTAASQANAARDGANAAASAANTAAADVNVAKEAATKAAQRITNLSVDMEMLPPAADPYAVVNQADTSMNIDLFVPKGTISYATFDIDPLTGMLWMYTDDGYTGPMFRVNDEGELEVVISA